MTPMSTTIKIPLRFNYHNRDDGAWCVFSLCSVTNPAGNRRCRIGCAASEVELDLEAAREQAEDQLTDGGTCPAMKGYTADFVFARVIRRITMTAGTADGVQECLLAEEGEIVLRAPAPDRGVIHERSQRFMSTHLGQVCAAAPEDFEEVGCGYQS